MKVVIALAAGLTVTACATPHQIVDRDDYLAEATRLFPASDRERVIRAAEIVLKQSDPGDWDFRYTTEGFTGLRRYVIYAVLASASGREKWEFNTELVDPKTIKASVSVSEAGVVTGGYDVTPYEGKMAFTELYRLFWRRVDYVLGRSSTWVTCQEALADLDSKKDTRLALGGLRGPTSQGQQAPPPPQMISQPARS